MLSIATIREMEERASEAHRRVNANACDGMEHLMILGLVADVQALIDETLRAKTGLRGQHLSREKEPFTTDCCLYCAADVPYHEASKCRACQQAEAAGHEIERYLLLRPDALWRRINNAVLAVRTDVRQTGHGLAKAITLIPQWLRVRYKSFAWAGEERDERGRWVLIHVSQKEQP